MIQGSQNFAFLLRIWAQELNPTLSLENGQEKL